MAPFEPAFRDGRSGADLIAELVEGKPYGHVLTYDELAAQLDVDPQADIHRIRSAVARAKPRLLRDHLRALEARPGRGYEILHPGENARLADTHRKKSDRQISRAIKVIKGADERDMTPAQRERNRNLGMVLERFHDRQQDMDARLMRLESLMLGGRRKVIPGTAEDIQQAIEPPKPGSDEDPG